ncbi:MAG: T9SS type A sorting domain-containing protein [Putridiphycobacter sp.]
MKTTTLIISTLISFFGISQKLVSISPLANFSVSQIQNTLASYGIDYSNMDLNPVNSYAVTYNTTDAHGNPTVASGAVYIPQLTNCNYAPITIYEHGTEFVESDVPSTGNYSAPGVFFSTSGYISVLPDYLGLGSNPGVHLYHHAETEATASIDLVRAVREYLDTASNTVKDNRQVFITGYSHGGHSAMATNKYVQDQNLGEEFKIIASAPLSGAYNLNGSQFDLIFDGDSTYYASPFLPYILAAMQEVYGNLYQNYNEVYDSPYDTNVDAYIQDGNKNIYQWYLMLGGANYYTFMQDSVLQNILADPNRDTHPINVALMQNNLYNWVPENPVRMLFCGADSMVSPNNSTFTLDTMLALGATDVKAINLNNNADHNGCYTPAITYALNWFDSLAVKCTYTALNPIEESSPIQIYPNPANHEVTLKGFNPNENSVKITNALGQIMEVKIIGNKIDISRLENGSYYLLIFEDNQLITQKSFVKL